MVQLSGFERLENKKEYNLWFKILHVVEFPLVLITVCQINYCLMPFISGFNRKRLSSSPGADGFFVSDVSFHDELSSSPAASTSNMSNRDLKPQDDPSQIFFRSVVFSPEVPIRLDYHGKHVDMDQVKCFVLNLVYISVCETLTFQACGQLSNIFFKHCW